MIPPIELPPELEVAALNLEQRLRILDIPTREIPLAEWDQIPEKLQPLIPAWIPSLLAKYRLLGSVLECTNNLDDATWPRFFHFIGPAEFKTILSVNDGIWNEEIFKEGLIPISFEQNGDLWVTSSHDGPSSPIYLFDLSGMQKIFACSRIELLMASMAVSPESYSDGNSGPHSVMWHPEQ